MALETAWKRQINQLVSRSIPTYPVTSGWSNTRLLVFLYCFTGISGDGGWWLVGGCGWGCFYTQLIVTNCCSSTSPNYTDPLRGWRWHPSQFYTTWHHQTDQTVIWKVEKWLLVFTCYYYRPPWVLHTIHIYFMTFGLKLPWLCLAILQSGNMSSSMQV